jgi:hypothetical protein
MIRWFIEDKEIGFLDDKSCITEETLLSFGKRIDFIFEEITCEEKL